MSIYSRRPCAARCATSERQAINEANIKYADLLAAGTAEGRKARRAAGLAVTVRMSDLLTEYEASLVGKSAGTQRAYKDSLKPIREYFVGTAGNPEVADVRSRDVLAFVDWRRNHRYMQAPKRNADGTPGEPKPRRPLSGRTLAKDRALLHQMFKLAERREYRLGNPVALTEKPKSDGRDPVLLTDQEYQRLIDACDDPMLRTFVVVLGETGFRCKSEALHLRWEDIDLDAGFVWIASGRDGHRTKSGKGRWMPITPSLDAALREHLAAFRFAGSPWVFHHRIDHGTRKKGARIKSLLHGYKAAAKRAGLPVKLNQHDLRHRRATTWMGEGMSPVLVKEALGHADLRTTMGYTHLSREHLRALVPKATGGQKAQTA